VNAGVGDRAGASDGDGDGDGDGDSDSDGDGDGGRDSVNDRGPRSSARRSLQCNDHHIQKRRCEAPHIASLRWVDDVAPPGGVPGIDAAKLGPNQVRVATFTSEGIYMQRMEALAVSRGGSA